MTSWDTGVGTLGSCGGIIDTKTGFFWWIYDFWGGIEGWIS
jgi:hypothetical protein